MLGGRWDLLWSLTGKDLAAEDSQLIRKPAVAQLGIPAGTKPAYHAPCPVA